MVALPPPAPPKLTVEAIYRAYEDRADNGYREHLGASLIGGNCERHLWYTFRWAARAVHEGRVLRLFKTGDLEEARLVNDLRSIGVTVMAVDPDTGKQFNLRDETGHFGGSMDGIGYGIPEARKAWHVLEFKTHGLKSFKALLKSGVAIAKPTHHAQMITYMHLTGIERALYLSVCKDTDEIYQERIKADPAMGEMLVRKAARVINATRPPLRISTTPDWFECAYCDHRFVCWQDDLPERHCRSCLHSTPVDSGRWTCAKHEKYLTFAEQKVGCDDQRYIPDFIRGGRAVDAEPGGAWIDYEFEDGTTWRDEGK